MPFNHGDLKKAADIYDISVRTLQNWENEEDGYRKKLAGFWSDIFPMPLDQAAAIVNLFQRFEKETTLLFTEEEIEFMAASILNTILDDRWYAQREILIYQLRDFVRFEFAFENGAELLKSCEEKIHRLDGISIVVLIEIIKNRREKWQKN